MMEGVMHRIAHSLYVRVRALFAVIGNCYKRAVCGGCNRFQRAEDLSVLRADHTSAEGMLSGVRKGVEAGVMVRSGSFASVGLVRLLF